MSTEVADWKEEARSLRKAGLSEREIAESVGKAASSVHDAVKDVVPDETPEEPPNGHAGEVDPGALDRAAGLAANREQAELDGSPAREPTAGQQTIDGQEVRPPIEELRVDGTAQLGMIDFGGKRPQSASLTLTGGKVLLVDGKCFKKGDVITGTYTAVVDEVGVKDKADPKTGIVVSAEQKHKARITDLQVTRSAS